MELFKTIGCLFNKTEAPYVFFDSKPDIDLVSVCKVVNEFVLGKRVDDHQVGVHLITFGVSVVPVARVAMKTLKQYRSSIKKYLESPSKKRF
jgi:hypothetical protein